MSDTKPAKNTLRRLPKNFSEMELVMETLETTSERVCNMELAKKTQEQMPRELSDMVWKYYQASFERNHQVPEDCPYAAFLDVHKYRRPCNKYRLPCDDYPCALLKKGSPVRDAYSEIYFKHTHFRFVSPQNLRWFLKQLRPRDLQAIREISLTFIVRSISEFGGVVVDRSEALEMFTDTGRVATEAFELLQQATGLKRLTIYTGVYEWPQCRTVLPYLSRIPGHEVLQQLRGLDYFSIQEDTCFFSPELKTWDHQCRLQEVDTQYTRELKAKLTGPRI